MSVLFFIVVVSLNKAGHFDLLPRGAKSEPAAVGGDCSFRGAHKHSDLTASHTL